MLPLTSPPFFGSLGKVILASKKRLGRKKAEKGPRGVFLFLTGAEKVPQKVPQTSIITSEIRGNFVSLLISQKPAFGAWALWSWQSGGQEGSAGHPCLPDRFLKNSGKFATRCCNFCLKYLQAKIERFFKSRKIRYYRVGNSQEMDEA